MVVVNTLIRWNNDKSIEDSIERILWMMPEKDFAFIIDVKSNKIPFTRRISDIENSITEGLAYIEDKDDFIRVIQEENITNLDKEKRDMSWEIISHIVIQEPLIFDSKHRSIIIEKAANEYGVTNRTVLNYLIRYWQRGKTKNALLPNFYLCGGKGKSKSVSHVKRGRPRKHAQLSGTGININEDIKKIFRVSINKFYHTSAKNSLTVAYELMCKEFFSKEFKIENGIRIPILRSSDEIPTFGQFKYWFNLERDMKKEIISRKSLKKYDQQHRPILGTSTAEAIGSGSIYQVDATIADVYLVSRFNRNWVIGRPIVYVIIDVFSRMITGLYVGLEGPSFLGAMNALANCASNKVAFCKQYDIEISEDDWPVNYLPDTLIADRGELEGKSIDNLINGIHLKIQNTPPYRADWKGIIEQNFHVMNERVKPFLPGTVDFDQRERGDRDYRLDAKLDISQFTQIMIRSILYHNNSHYLKNYNREEMMIQHDVKSIPIELWNWGIKNRAGKLRNIPEDIVKLYLMPSDTAVVTAKGIKFKNMYYSSKTSLKEKWHERARNKGTWKVEISYDPRNMNFIYIKDVYGEGFEKCTILEHQASYIDKTYEEIEYMLQKEKMDIKSNEKTELQSKVDLISQIEDIVKRAKRQTDEGIDITESKRKKLNGIKENRILEKMINRENETFRLDDTQDNGVIIHDNQEIYIEEKINPYDDISLLRKKQKEGLKKAYE